MFVATGGSTSIRQFERPCREAGATARVLLCQAAAARWDTEWEQCQVDKGFVTFGKKRLAFADLVADAAALEPPSPIPLNPSARNRLSGRDAPRLDLASKVDGSVSFAGDIRLPDMLFASVRGGPTGKTTLKSLNSKAAFKIRVVNIVKTEHWVASIALNCGRRTVRLMPWHCFRDRRTDGRQRQNDRCLARCQAGRRDAHGASGDVDCHHGEGGATRVFNADYSALPLSTHRLAALQPPTIAMAVTAGKSGTASGQASCRKGNWHRCR
jgi:isoquinoline 1-oxidoreductase beta subunit